MSSQSNKCKKCDKKNRNAYFIWCKLCQTNNFKKNFACWSSENKQIDGFIQERQLNISSPRDIIFEWIPYNQFDNIKEISKGDHATVHSAV